ncbi:MAG TPA: DUF6249 domain-containing protein [Vicinamibacterales bacterium]
MVVFTVIVFAALFVLFLAVQSRRHVREMEHRERLAMIERGLIPSPEADPGRFEEALSPERSPQDRSVVRLRSAGVMMIGLGLAFMFLMFATRKPEVGVGVGGAFALIGAAFFVNATLMSRSAPRQFVRPTPPARRSENRDAPTNPPESPRMS